MWPASKVFPKELFPLGRLPILAHVIGEMLDAGILDITIVVRNDNSRAIEALLDARIAPPSSVQQDPVVRRFEHMIRAARFTLVEQNGPYGNGTPFLNGAMTDETLRPCVFAFADDVVLGENVSRGLIESVWRTDRFEPRQMLPLSLSYDHRVIDGADAMRFLRWVVEAIEQPFLLSLLG